MNRRAIYAASLDPVTNGHINVIERLAPLYYDKLIVLVAVDSRKNYTFTPEERMEMVRAAISHLPNVSVDVCIGKYAVKYAEEKGVRVLIRGLRNFKDLDAEQGLAEENRHIAPSVETLFVPCHPHLMYVSSSLVKDHVGIDPGWEKEVARLTTPLVVRKLKEKYISAKAKKYWLELMELLGNPPRSEEIFLDLVRQYTEAGRFYHNLEHIISMLDELRNSGLNISDRIALELAIWFHDAVYDSGLKSHTIITDNETKSADLAEQALITLGLTIDRILKVKDMIMATTHKEPATEEIARIVIDLDLAILGKSDEVFDAYEHGIREEYSWASETDFKFCRAKVLRSFLDRPHIFATKYFRTLYEAKARENLLRSITSLEQTT